MYGHHYGSLRERKKSNDETTCIPRRKKGRIDRRQSTFDRNIVVGTEAVVASRNGAAVDKTRGAVLAWTQLDTVSRYTMASAKRDGTRTLSNTGL